METKGSQDIIVKNRVDYRINNSNLGLLMEIRE